MNGAPGEIRTPDLLLRRQSLYPSELRAHSSSLSLHVSLGTINVSIGRERPEGRDTDGTLQPGMFLSVHAQQSTAGQQDAACGRENVSGQKSELNSGRVLRRRRRRRDHHVRRRALRHGLRGRVHRLRHAQS
jgi:hypothetical protein